jgi:hypothetical protein
MERSSHCAWMRSCLRGSKGRGFPGVPAVGVDLGLCGRAEDFRFVHVVCLRRMLALPFAYYVTGWVCGGGWHSVLVIGNRREGIFAGR